MTRVGAAVRRLTALLAAEGVESARLDAELLVAHVLGSDRSRLFLSPDRPLTAPQERALEDAVRRRVEDRESIAHLLGVRGFRYLDLAVDRRALIPRPETELLVELALELPKGATVIDVGTGSGAIALAVADERPDLVVHATDVSPDALALARENAERLGLAVHFHEGDLLAGYGTSWGTPCHGGTAVGAPDRVGGASGTADGPAGRADGASDLADGPAGRADGASDLADGASGTADGPAGSADGASDPADGPAGRADGASGTSGGEAARGDYLAVLSNPPYIPLGDHDELPPEVRRHDPHLALFGGDDGLDVIRRLIPEAWNGGADVLAIEVGQGQPPAVVELLMATGFARTEVRDDLAGIGRVVVGWRDGARSAVVGDGAGGADPDGTGGGGSVRGAAGA